MTWRLTTLPAYENMVDAGSIEQKFLFGASKKEFLLDWLEFQLVRQPGFYFSPILSLYYDTLSFDCYRQVRNGDYLKNKLRLRWYQPTYESENEVVHCYLEIKRKCGTIRTKQRTRVQLQARCLLGELFNEPDIASLAMRFPELQSGARGILVPILVVEYQRHRFIDPKSGCRVSLDTGIACRRANPAVVPITTPLDLGCGVLEVKGKRDSLPALLHPLSGHLRKQSFSKYAKCFEYLIAPLLWREPA